MEALEEAVASEVGPKWVQLFSRLGVTDARDRYRIDCEHAAAENDEQVKHKKCALHTIRLWKSSLQCDSGESDIMRELLLAVRKIVGLEAFADRLCESHGLRPLVSPPPSPPSPHYPPSPPSPLSPPISPLFLPRRQTELQATPPSLSHPHTHNSHPPPPTHPYMGEPHQPLGWSTQAACMKQEQNTEELLNTRINLQLTRHKFAVLDLCQRLQGNKWLRFAQCLGLTDTQELMRLEREDRFQLEERYYKTIKMWLHPLHTLSQHQHQHHHRCHDDQWSTTAAPHPTSSVSPSPSPPSPSSECCTFGMLRTALLESGHAGTQFQVVLKRLKETESNCY